MASIDKNARTAQQASRERAERAPMNDLIVNGRLTIPASQLEVTVSRSSGPGGQNVNKVNSKVTMRWQVRDQPLIDPGWRKRLLARHGGKVNARGELVLSSDRYREQPRNIGDCRQKLKSFLLECQAPPKPRKETRPSAGSKRRRLEKKQQQSQKKRLRRTPSWD